MTVELITEALNSFLHRRRKELNADNLNNKGLMVFQYYTETKTSFAAVKTINGILWYATPFGKTSVLTLSTNYKKDGDMTEEQAMDVFIKNFLEKIYEFILSGELDKLIIKQ